MKKLDHKSWDAKKAAQQRIPEWPMFTFIFIISFLSFLVMKYLGYE